MVPEEVRKCVIFLQYQSGQGPQFAGTAFLVALKDELNPGEWFTYAVTAKHVIEFIRENSPDDDVHVRANLSAGGTATFAAHASLWLPHPTDSTTDVAVLEWPDDDGFDVLKFPLPYAAATEVEMRQAGIGVGDEVFLVGLFHLHHGRDRNIPIVRVGNIAAMPEEPVQVGTGGELMDAYLIEARSIGGLSGSPVFVQPGGAPLMNFPETPLAVPAIFLLGLMHGHWNIDAAQIDDGLSGEATRERLNTGIGVVVPITKVLETIQQERLAQRRKDTVAQRRAKRIPHPDQ
jgi:hypothetical protein